MPEGETWRALPGKVLITNGKIAQAKVPAWSKGWEEGGIRWTVVQKPGKTGWLGVWAVLDWQEAMEGSGSGWGLESRFSGVFIW